MQRTILGRAPACARVSCLEVLFEHKMRANFMAFVEIGTSVLCCLKTAAMSTANSPIRKSRRSGLHRAKADIHSKTVAHKLLRFGNAFKHCMAASASPKLQAISTIPSGSSQSEGGTDFSTSLQYAKPPDTQRDAVSMCSNISVGCAASDVLGIAASLTRAALSWRTLWMSLANTSVRCSLLGDVPATSTHSSSTFAS